MLKVLVVDDDAGLRFSIRSTLESARRFKIEEAFDGINALEKFKAATTEKFDIVLLDVDMPRLNGLETLKKIKELEPATIVLVLTAHAQLADAVQAVKDGAYNYLSKPVNGEALIELIDKAVMANTLISNIAASAPVLVEEGRKIIGNTSQMQKVFNIIHRLAKVDTPVLIRGASGTGKELVARAIHFNSARKDSKFVAINCSAIPENLFESELFGHEKGSFTGADQRKIGKFQYAEGGTLFHRLNVVPIFLPSLAERKDDIERLISIFIKKFNETHKKRITGISADAMAVLKKHNWPGNIRELENVVEHAFVLESSHIITLASLPEAVLASCGVDLLQLADAVNAVKLPDHHETNLTAESDRLADLESDEDLEGEGDIDLTGEPVSGDLDFNAQKEAFEKEFIIKALKTFKGRINQTALHANIPKKTLLRKIEKYGIVAKDYNN
jgi:DNA-binding NtrC family response regulator